MDIEILYKDKDILVCVKPYGMPIESDKTRDKDLLSILKHKLYADEQMDEEPYLAMINRLDRPVGGVTLFARNREIAAKLSDMMQDGDITKFYQAVLSGEVPDDMGTLTDYLLKDSKNNISKVVDKNTKNAKKAVLDYEVLDIMETDIGVLSYVLIELMTGRHHQIRAQFANIGCPIYGDEKYGQNGGGRGKKKNNLSGQIALYSTRLEFVHPVTGEELVFKCEPDGPAFEILDLEEM